MEAVYGSFNSGTLHAEFMMFIEGYGVGGTMGMRTSGTAVTREPRLSLSWNRDLAEDPQGGQAFQAQDGASGAKAPLQGLAGRGESCTEGELTPC